MSKFRNCPKCSEKQKTFRRNKVKGTSYIWGSYVWECPNCSSHLKENKWYQYLQILPPIFIPFIIIIIEGYNNYSHIIAGIWISVIICFLIAYTLPIELVNNNKKD